MFGRFDCLRWATHRDDGWRAQERQSAACVCVQLCVLAAKVMARSRAAHGAAVPAVGGAAVMAVRGTTARADARTALPAGSRASEWAAACASTWAAVRATVRALLVLRNQYGWELRRQRGRAGGRLGMWWGSASE